MCRPAGDCPRCLGGEEAAAGTRITVGAPAAQVQPRDAEVTAGGRPLCVTGDTGAITPS